MSNFSMKPAIPQKTDVGGVSSEQWVEWNEYLRSLISAPEVDVAGKNKKVKTKTLVGILNFIMDVGYQPQQDGKYDTKCELPLKMADGTEEKYSREELAHIAKFPTNDFIWFNDNGVRKRKQTSPNRPEQEYVFFFDFPEVMVDFTKHPDEKFHKLGSKPLRVSYNGRFGKIGSMVFNRTLPMALDIKLKTLSVKNPIYKIADKLGVSQEFIKEGYDLGVLAGKACKWAVSNEKRTHEGSTYYDFTITDPSKIEEVVAGDIKITVEQQIPKCNTTFTGVHFNADSYDNDVIEYIKEKRELMEVVQRAVAFKPSPIKYPDFVLGCDFKDSGLAKFLLKTPSEGSVPKSEVEVEEEYTPPSVGSNSPTSSGDAEGEDLPFDF